MKETIGIGLMGLGVVGSRVAQTLTEKSLLLAAKAGCPLKLKKVLVQNPTKKRAVKLDPQLLTTDVRELWNDPEIEVIIEVIGGEDQALQYVRESLTRGKHVVTANKEVIAKHGPELLSLAEEHKVELRYEASVGGGIPIINPFKQDLLANELTAIHAIINGTTNYILTRMAEEGLDFATALREAQGLGYAEADPRNDIEGTDAAYKLAILASLGFHTEVRPKDVYCEGISRLAPCDFRYARELGYAIKLLAIAKREGRSVQTRVHPAFLPEHLLLAKVNGVYNAIQVEGDLIGRVLFYGQGAGPRPTSSAILADLLHLAQNIRLGISPTPSLKLNRGKAIMPISDIQTSYYLRLTVADRPGVLAQMAKVLGDHHISIASVIQKEADKKAQTAEVVMMTYPAREAAMQQASAEMSRLEVVKEISNLIRVEE